ncbi:MAG: hypothetical protein Q8O88_01310 [bacterium]|nr:hypothetical protein [bacterium]
MVSFGAHDAAQDAADKEAGKTAPAKKYGVGMSTVLEAESQARLLNPSFQPLDTSRIGNINDRENARFKHAMSAFAESKAIADANAKAANDLKNQVRSEIGEDGDETYFETYIDPLTIGIVNIFLNKNNDNYFILGSAAGAALLGSMTIGSVAGSFSRIEENQSIQDFIENFTTTTYQDAATTAAGWGTGSLIFSTSGSVAILSNWKSGSYFLTEFDRVLVDILFNQYGGSATTFETSFNGGSDYTTITPFLEMSGSPVGSDFRLRITDPHGSLVLTELQIYTKGDNFN